MQIPHLLKSYNGLPISSKTTAMIADYLRNLNHVIIYGWHVDPNISDPYNAVTYLNDAIGKRPSSLYRPVEYIGCTGTQYVLTDIIPKNNYKYEMEYQITNTTAGDSAYRSLFGTLEFENGSVIARAGMNFGNPFTSYTIAPYLANNTFAGTSYSSSAATTKNKVILARPKSKFNQMEITMPGSAELAEPTIPLVIFGDNRKEDSAVAYASPYKITANFLVYSFKIYNTDDVLIHSLIPVECQSNSELGLYDTITNKFYTNSGTGTFIKGSYINSQFFDYGDWEKLFFMPKPCMLKYDGTVDYYLDSNDYTKISDKNIVNLKFNYDDIEPGNISSDGSEYSSTTHSRSIGYAETVPGQILRVSGVAENEKIRIYFFSSGKSVLSSGIYGNENATVPGNTYYFRVVASNESFTENFYISRASSDIANLSYDGNAMMEWPLIWYKFEGPESKDYRPVEYIKSTGTQYILTDIIPNYQMRIDAEIMLGNSVVSTSKGGIFGFINNDRRFAMLLTTDRVSSNTVNIYGYCGYPWSSPDSTFSFGGKQVSTLNTKLLWRLSHSELRVGTDTRNNLPTITQQAPNQNLVIMGIINNDSVIYSFGMMNYMQLYSLKIYDENNILIHDLQPMERQSDGELGLYDKLTDKFYTNAGTGTFQKGAYTDVGEGFFYCSNKQVDNTFNCWCNYDSNNNIINHFYTSIYNGTIINGKMRSLSGLALGSNGGTAKSGNEEVTAALANNIDQSVLPEWYTAVWSDWQLITALLILMGKSLNLSAVFGKGYIIADGQQAANYVTGSAGNAAGLFHGDTSGTQTSVKVFGMENWWGCIWHRRAGLNTSVPYYCYKLTYGTADGTSIVGYQGDSVAGYNPIMKDDIPLAYLADGYIKQMYFGKHGIIPLQVVSSSGLYYDGKAFGNRSSYLVTGGASGEGSMCIAVNNPFTASYVHIGSSLSCKPLKTTL